MEQRLNNLKSFFKPFQAPPSEPSEPEIGFKLTFSKSSKQLRVKVIGARHLPANYGTIKPHGYSVKVKFKKSKKHLMMKFSRSLFFPRKKNTKQQLRKNLGRLSTRSFPLRCIRPRSTTRISSKGSLSRLRFMRFWKIRLKRQ